MDSQVSIVYPNGLMVHTLKINTKQKYMRVNQFRFKNLQEAWEGLHDYLFNKEKLIRKRGGGTYGSEMVQYDNIIMVEDGRIDKNFNFGRCIGYSYKKWSKLINNYVNFNYLDLIKSEVRDRESKRANSYNYTYHFDNSHGSGKDCLISLTFCRRKGKERPIVIYNTRASEVTKRLIFDFLLIQRIAEYVYGRKQRVEVVCFIPFMFINLECSLMYLSDRGIDKCLKPNKSGEFSDYQNRLRIKYQKFLDVDLDKVKYKVHKRAAAQVQRKPNGDPVANVKNLYAYELKLHPINPNKLKVKDIAELDREFTSNR